MDQNMEHQIRNLLRAYGFRMGDRLQLRKKNLSFYNIYKAKERRW
jgi:hypothetical protein